MVETFTVNPSFDDPEASTYKTMFTAGGLNELDSVGPLVGRLVLLISIY